MIQIEIAVVADERRVVLNLSRLPTDSLEGILDEALLQAGLANVIGSWSMRYEGRRLALHLTLAEAIEGIGGRAVIALEVALESDPFDDPDPSSRDNLENDRTVQLDALSDFELEASDPGSEVFAVDEEDLDPSPPGTPGAAALDRDEDEVLDSSGEAATSESSELGDLGSERLTGTSEVLTIGEDMVEPMAPVRSPRAATVPVGGDPDVTVDLPTIGAPARKPRHVERHATIRYYTRMNPLRIFPMLVVLSQETIRDALKKGVGQNRSRRFQLAIGSRVEIEPVLPGCACYPSRASLRIAPGAVETTFWVVPQVLGMLPAPRVVLHLDGEVLAEVPLEITVARQTVAVAMGAAGFFLPFGMAILKHLRLDFETQLGEGFGLYGRMLKLVLGTLTPEMIAVPLLATALAFYLLCRPRSRDAFWDIDPVGPQEKTRTEIETVRVGSPSKG